MIDKLTIQEIRLENNRAHCHCHIDHPFESGDVEVLFIIGDHELLAAVIIPFSPIREEQIVKIGGQDGQCLQMAMKQK